MTLFTQILKDSRGYLLIILASILWGSMGILAKLSYAHGISPETLIALRLVIGFVTLSVPLAVFDRKSFRLKKADFLLFIVLGVFAITIQRLSYFFALSITTATVAAILFYTYPIFVAISASIFLKEQITSEVLLAILLAFSGVALVVKVYDISSLNANFVGIVFGLCSSILFALYFIVTKKLRRQYSGWTATVYGDGIGALMLIPVIYLSAPSIAGFSFELWLLILLIAWIPSLLAYLLYSYALKYVEASKGSILSVTEPLSAAIFSATILGESLETLQILGIAFALIGVVLLFRKGKTSI